MTVLLYVALDLYHVILLYTFQLSYRHPGGHVRIFLKALKHSCHHQDSKAHLEAPVKVCITIKPHEPPNRRCGKSEAEASLKLICRADIIRVRAPCRGARRCRV